jgi:hypothetical protein
MPMKRELYPADWEQISARIRFERAEGRCEAIREDGTRCGAPHGEWICRYESNREDWVLGDDLTNTGEATYLGDPILQAIRVVLTVAHIDHDTTNSADGNLAAWCQLHHLRHDAKHHARNAARTRAQKKGLQSLFDEATRGQ